MEKDKLPQQQTTNETESKEGNVWSSGFNGKGSASLPPPAMNLSTTGETAQLQDEGDTETEYGRKAEDGHRRVDMNRNADNRAYNRWDNKGQDSKYVATFTEKFKEQSKALFGEELTQDQVLAKIDAAEAEGKTAEAEDLRKKLFAANQYAVVETLDSPNNSIYQKTSSSTYCNIYAYDVVTALGGYLPRLWWTSETAEKIKNGELKEDEITVKYGEGVTEEMSANKLNDWMRSYGKDFGWVQAASMKTAQEAANDGNIVIILASNKNAAKSGHVNVILAETEQHKSLEHTDGTTLPLQSQAGGTNFKYDTYTQATTGATNPKWWENSSHKDGAAWIFMGQIKSPILTPEQVGVAPTISKDKVAEGQGDANLPGMTTANTNTNTNSNSNTNTNPATNTNSSTANVTVNPDQKPVEQVSTTTNNAEQTTTTTEQTTTKENTAGTNKPKKDPNTLHLSSGVMMLATEGAFDGGANDVRKPHFPENLAFYRKVTKDDEIAWAKLDAKKRPARYLLASDATDRVKAKSSGDLVRAQLLDRFSPSDYDKNPPAGQVIATGPNNSGVTIGMGFDLGARFGTGDKAKAKKEMMDAGIAEASAEKLSGAVGLRTRKAGKMAAQLRESGLTITAKQVLDLLSKTRKSYFQNFTKGVVHPAIEEVMVKINYWKGGTGAKEEVEAIFNAAKGKQGLAQFDAAIEEMRKHDGKTYVVGVKFLTIVRNHIAAGGKVEFEDGAGTVESLTDGSNDTFRVINEATKDDKGKNGKDLQKQLSGNALPESSGLNSKSTTPKTTATKTTTTTNGSTTAPKSDVKPENFILTQYQAYQAGTIDMPKLAKSVKPYASGSNGKMLVILIGQLGWSEQDNFAYSLASNSSDGELKGFDEGLLAKMSEALDTWFTTSFEANATQKARVDAARTGIAIDKLRARLAEQQQGKSPKKVEPAGKGKEGMTYGPLLKSTDWVSQADPKDYPDLPTLKKGELNASSYGVACYDCCVAMLKRKGFPVGSNNLTTLQDLKADGKTSVPKGAHEKGLQTIDAMLAKGQPVIVGVDKGERSDKYHGHTQSKTDANKGRATDHWVVIHGKGTDANGHSFYVYFDPARYNTAGGTSLTENRLIVDSANSRTVDDATYMKSSYVISDVRY